MLAPETLPHNVTNYPLYGNFSTPEANLVMTEIHLKIVSSYSDKKLQGGNRIIYNLNGQVKNRNKLLKRSVMFLWKRNGITPATKLGIQP